MTKQERLNEVKDMLADATENPSITKNRTKNKQLTLLLDVINYIEGDRELMPEKNPLEDWAKYQGMYA